MEFTLWNDDGFSKTVKSNKDGIVLIKDISYGDYGFKLTKAPEGYPQEGYRNRGLKYEKGNNEISIDGRLYEIKDGIVSYLDLAI